MGVEGKTAKKDSGLPMRLKISSKEAMFSLKRGWKLVRKSLGGKSKKGV